MGWPLNRLLPWPPARPPCCFCCAAACARMSDEPACPAPPTLPVRLLRGELPASKLPVPKPPREDRDRGGELPASASRPDPAPPKPGPSSAAPPLLAAAPAPPPDPAPAWPQIRLGPGNMADASICSPPSPEGAAVPCWSEPRPAPWAAPALPWDASPPCALRLALLVPVAGLLEVSGSSRSSSRLLPTSSSPAGRPWPPPSRLSAPTAELPAPPWSQPPPTGPWWVKEEEYRELENRPEPGE
mmetsp:Transcript_25315/g.64327  ORF Transcript_25315/g.64327 Transcript_25315/m.64327 type:complete len:243 (-) Transcript_25315:23-751(-)